MRFVHASRIEASADEVWSWHARPGAFERLTPPWEDVRVLARKGGIADGGRVTLSVGIGPLRRRWVAEHRDARQGELFRDVQVDGPFRRWDHIHRTRALAPGLTELEDTIEIELPLAAVAEAVAGRWLRMQLERMFRYRHRITRDDIAAHRAAREVNAMKLLVTGSTGLVGSALVPFLTTGGHTVVRLVRPPASAGPGAVLWDPERGHIDAAGLEGLDGVVHLAGDSIAEGRWNAAKKERIRKSRSDGTRLLAETLAKLKKPPRVLVSASAVGFYGSRGDEVLGEDSAPGRDFLAEVCREWEAATEPARKAGIRVVNPRIGFILSPKGGGLAKMLTPFRLGAGGRIGDGRQWMSWIAIDDVVGALHHALVTDSLSGPVNLVAPGTVTNAEFTRTLGRVLHRPTVFPVPAFAARAAFGEMADALLLASQRVEPRRLIAASYAFRHPALEDALRHLLGRG